jgi:hypothetical protein
MYVHDLFHLPPIARHASDMTDSREKKVGLAALGRQGREKGEQLQRTGDSEGKLFIDG